jgi:nicotinamidase-related amidase
MTIPLLVVDVQNGVLNAITGHIPARIAQLIARGDHAPLLFTRFVNPPGSPYREFLKWDACAAEPETCLAPEVAPFARPDLTFTKPGYAGIPDELAAYLRDHRDQTVAVVGIDTDMCVLKVAMDIFDLGIRPIILCDCCASTAGLQAHFAGLAVLARNIGADQLRDAGLDGGRLGAPPDAVPDAAAPSGA